MMRGVRVYFGVVVCAFLFFKAANASCLNATQEVHSSGMCYPALTSLGNTSVCNMSSQCGLLFDDVLTFCNSTEPLYDEVLQGLDLLCNAPPGCFNATQNIQGDYFCDMARMNLSVANPGTTCSGPCWDLLNDLVNECGNNATGAGIQAGLNALCANSTSSISPSSTSVVATTSANINATVNATHYPTPTSPPVACLTALGTFSNNTVCMTALTGNVTNVSMLCEGTCRTLLNAILSACGDSDVVTQADIDEHCGGAGALKGMGVLVILLMAVLAVLVH